MLIVYYWVKDAVQMDTVLVNSISANDGLFELRDKPHFLYFLDSLGRKAVTN